MRPIGTSQELERRRRRAVQLMDQGESPTVIARILGVARGSLYRWKAQAQRPQGLSAHPHPGRPVRLSPAQEAQLVALLKKGATAHGWSNNLWTAVRVTEIIQRHFGLSYHPEHVRKIVKQRLGWTSQQIHHRARERDEKKIDAWRDHHIERIQKKSGTAKGPSRLRR